MTKIAITSHSIKDSARRAKSAVKSVSTLINRISCQWRLVDPNRTGLADLVGVLAWLLEASPAFGEAHGLSPRQKMFLNFFDQELQGSLLSSRLAYVQAHADLLSAQGLTFFHEQTLAAFFLSKIYEGLRYGGNIEDEHEPSAPAKASRRRGRRPNGAYFSPPSLAYLAARQACVAMTCLQGQSAPPRIVDPACGTGVFLLAALDCLRGQFAMDAALIARRCLYGAEMDPTTLAVAKICMELATGESGSAIGLEWADGLCHDFGEVNVVVSNPPWHQLKEAGQLSRVNKARAAHRRQKFESHGANDTNLYKLFIERSLQITAGGARIAILVPASFLSDSQGEALRARLSREGRVESIFGFANIDGAFAIHEQFKYALIDYQKGARSGPMSTVFGLVATQSRLVDNPVRLQLSAADVGLLAGGARSRLPEVESAEALSLTLRVCAEVGTFGDFVEASEGKILLRREFDMTLDRPKMIGADKLERSIGRKAGRKAGLKADSENSDWLPLLQGAMVDHYKVDQYKVFEKAAYYLRKSDFLERCPQADFKIGFQSISSSLNSRSMIAAVLPNLPVGNSLTTVVFKQSQTPGAGYYTVALFNSFVFDYFLRTRLSGTTITYQLLLSLPFPVASEPLYTAIAALGEKLSNDAASEPATAGGEDTFAAASLRSKILLEILVARAYRISPAEMRHVLRHCHHPKEMLARRRRLDADLPEDLPDLTGFFRIDKTLPAEQRLTSLILEAFHACGEGFEANMAARFATLSSSEAVGAIRG